MSTRSLFALIGRIPLTSSSLQTNKVRSISSSSSNYSRKNPDPSHSTLSKKLARNPFSAPPNSVLAYVGPYAASLRQGKSVAFVFGACGCMAVPATLILGNTEYLLATIAGLVSLSPSVLIHSIFRNDVTKIYVQGSVSIKAPTAVKVSATDSLKLTLEKLSWRGVPIQTQVLSTDLYVKSESEKNVTWTTTKAALVNSTLTPTPTKKNDKKSAAAAAANDSGSSTRKEMYRIDKMMMLNNPSFSFVMDQIEHQSRLSYSKHITTEAKK